MGDTVKRIYSIILLMVFLLPSTGILMYVHRCNMSNSILVDIEAQKPCCAKVVTSNNTEHNLSCSVSGYTKDQNQTAVSAQPCCDDSQVYVKLGVHLLTHSVKVLHAYFSLYINNIACQYSFMNNDQGAVIASNLYNFPPGEQHFSKFSSLRL